MKKLYRLYTLCLLLLLCISLFCVQAFAVEDMWTAANRIIIDVYNKIAGISTKNGWQLVPFDTDMAHEKVDAQLLGFKINGAQTTKNGNAETFALSAPWEIAENGRLPIVYDAVVSAVSQPVTEQDVLSIVFVVEWKE